MATPTCITVKASGTYDILLTKGGLARIGETLSERFKPCTIAILSDDKVFPMCSPGAALKDTFDETDLKLKKEQ